MEILSPMVGKIVKILVAKDQDVSEDDPVVILEAMKVEMPVVAPEDGKITDILVSEGDAVEADQVIIEMEEA